MSHIRSINPLKRLYAHREYGSRVTDFGGKGQPIILLHGFLASSRYWKKLQPYLSRAGYRVIAIDLLGFGKAPKPKHSDYSYNEHVTYLHMTIKQCQLHSPAIVIGHSMGALLAARYSRIYPSDVARLIMLHPPLYKDSFEAYKTLRETSWIYQFLLDSRYRRIGWIIIKTLAGFHIGTHGRQARERSLRNVIEKAEAFDDLKTINVDTMLVVGSKDRAEYMNNLINHDIASNTVIEKIGTTHHSPIRDTEQIQQLILEFIASKSSEVNLRS